jgi:hypothetical protein
MSAQLPSTSSVCLGKAAQNSRQTYATEQQLPLTIQETNESSRKIAGRPFYANQRFKQFTAISHLRCALGVASLCQVILARSTSLRADLHPPREARIGNPTCGARKVAIDALCGTTALPSTPLRQAQGHLQQNAKVVP